MIASYLFLIFALCIVTQAYVPYDRMETDKFHRHNDINRLGNSQNQNQVLDDATFSLFNILKYFKDKKSNDEYGSYFEESCSGLEFDDSDSTSDDSDYDPFEDDEDDDDCVSSSEFGHYSFNSTNSRKLRNLLNKDKIKQKVLVKALRKVSNTSFDSERELLHSLGISRDQASVLSSSWKSFYRVFYPIKQKLTNNLYQDSKVKTSTFPDKMNKHYSTKKNSKTKAKNYPYLKEKLTLFCNNTNDCIPEMITDSVPPFFKNTSFSNQEKNYTNSSVNLTVDIPHNSTIYESLSCTFPKLSIIEMIFLVIAFLYV